MGSLFFGFLNLTAKLIISVLRIARTHFTHTFVLLVFAIVLLFNFTENSGRVVFSLGVFDSEILEASAAQSTVKIAIDYHNKDALSFDEAGIKQVPDPRGGPEEEEYIDVATTGDDALTLALPALTTNASQNKRSEVLTYIVQSGDTVSKIAADFGVTVNTVLWENGLRATSYIKEGQELKILPVTGIQHDVKKGDTVSTIAKKYKAKTSEIIAFNSLPADGALQTGETLIIPDGEVPRVYAPRIPSVPVYAKSTVNASKYFIFPSSGRRTQGLHGYNAIDVGNKCGTPVYAAASGVVSSSKTTNSRARLGASVFGGYGNHVRIKHPNGTQTLYAHLRSNFVSSGQSVKQGQQIGTIGGGFEYIKGRLYRMQGAGKSTGCHLHFEVRGAKNPLTNFWRY